MVLPQQCDSTSGTAETGGAGAADAIVVRPNPSSLLSLRQALVTLGMGGDGPVRADIHDATGRHIRTLCDGPMGTGVHTVIWDGRDEGRRPVAAANRAGIHGPLAARLVRHSNLRQVRSVMCQHRWILIALSLALASMLLVSAQAEVWFWPARLDSPVGSSPRAFVASDFDEDTFADVVVCGSDSITVYLGRSDGWFDPAMTCLAGNNLTAITSGDLNHDLHEDLVVTNTGEDSLAVLLGAGDGTFGPPVDYQAESSPRDVAICDLDGDDRPDLVAANYASSDINELDFVAGNHTSWDITVMLGTGDGSFGQPFSCPTDWGGMVLAIGDLNGDQILDLAVTGQNTDCLAVLLGVGDGTFVPAGRYGTGEHRGSY